MAPILLDRYYQFYTMDYPSDPPYLVVESVLD